jgi:uncharacterized membrane protein
MDRLTEMLSLPTGRAVLSVLALIVLSAIVFWLVARFRDRAMSTREDPEQALAKFAEMRQRGDISEAEFRTIRAVLGEAPRESLKDTGGMA